MSLEQTDRRDHRACNVLMFSTFVSIHLWLLALAGCENWNPLSKNDFYVPVTTPDKVHIIDPLELEERSAADPVTLEEAAAEMQETAAEPGLAEVREPLPLSLAEVRAASLANNLDLRVALFDPTIAETVVAEEEARFEWTFVGSARRTDIDAPSASQLTNSQATIDDFNLGVEIPLRTGGFFNVNLPLNRTETNNIFSLLNPSFESDLQFSISQPLLRNAGLRPNTHGIRVAKYQTRISEALTKLEAIRILAQADRVYWLLYAARKELEVRQQQYELAIAQLQRAQRRVDAEVAPRIEVVRARSGVAQRLEAIIIAQNEVRERQRDLKRIMHRDDLPLNSPIDLIPTTEPRPLGLQLDAEPLAQFALENRMEMLELELQLAIAMSTIDFQKNQALPLVVLDYTYNINGLGGNFGNSFDLLGSRRFADWAVGVNVEIPLGNEAAEARVHRAILERLQRLATKSQRELAIRQEVFNAADQLETTWQRVLAARQAAILAGEVLLGEQRQYDAGERTSTDILIAAADLAEAQSSEIRALADYQIAQVDLAFATGTLLGRDQIRWEAIGDVDED